MLLIPPYTLLHICSLHSLTPYYIYAPYTPLHPITYMLIIPPYTLLHIMLTKIKDKFTKAMEDDPQAKKKLNQSSLLPPQQIKAFRRMVQQSKQNIQRLLEQSKTIQNPNTLKNLLSDILSHLSKIQQIQEDTKGKVDSSLLKEMQLKITRSQAQVKNLRLSDQNNKEIINTLKQQSQLLSKETKQLQQKNNKLEQNIINLTEQKGMLLQLRNSDGKGGQGVEYERKLNNERMKVQQKQKEIQVLKKKLQEDRESLEKIADELKDKELQSRKVLDKYERSKAEIRKYREEKTEFIKKLNMEMAQISSKNTILEKNNSEAMLKIQSLQQKIEDHENAISMNTNRGVQLESVKEELNEVRREILEINKVVKEKDVEINNLMENNRQMQDKRKSLLEALEKPISHEMKTLDKIIRALEKLYKEYISVVFQQGNIVGFENRITYILSNVRDIKEDLYL